MCDESTLTPELIATVLMQLVSLGVSFFVLRHQKNIEQRMSQDISRFERKLDAELGGASKHCERMEKAAFEFVALLHDAKRAANLIAGDPNPESDRLILEIKASLGHAHRTAKLTANAAQPWMDDPSRDAATAFNNLAAEFIGLLSSAPTAGSTARNPNGTSSWWTSFNATMAALERSHRDVLDAQRKYIAQLAISPPQPR